MAFPGLDLPEFAVDVMRVAATPGVQTCPSVEPDRTYIRRTVNAAIGIPLRCVAHLGFLPRGQRTQNERAAASEVVPYDLTVG